MQLRWNSLSRTIRVAPKHDLRSCSSCGCSWCHGLRASPHSSGEVRVAIGATIRVAQARARQVDSARSSRRRFRKVRVNRARFGTNASHPGNAAQLHPGTVRRSTRSHRLECACRTTASAFGTRPQGGAGNEGSTATRRAPEVRCSSRSREGRNLRACPRMMERTFGRLSSQERRDGSNLHRAR